MGYDHRKAGMYRPDDRDATQQEEMTNVPPQQYNTMGNAKPVFSQQAQAIV